MRNKKYILNDALYIWFKKHTCPQCGVKTERVKISKIVNSESADARKYDFSLGDGFMVGDVEFIWYAFECSNCKQRFSVQEMKKTEKRL